MAAKVALPARAIWAPPHDDYPPLDNRPPKNEQFPYLVEHVLTGRHAIQSLWPPRVPRSATAPDQSDFPVAPYLLVVMGYPGTTKDPEAAYAWLCKVFKDVGYVGRPPAYFGGESASNGACGYCLLAMDDMRDAQQLLHLLYWPTPRPRFDANKTLVLACSTRDTPRWTAAHLNPLNQTAVSFSYMIAGQADPHYAQAPPPPTPSSARSTGSFPYSFPPSPVYPPTHRGHSQSQPAGPAPFGPGSRTQSYGAPPRPSQPGSYPSGPSPTQYHGDPTQGWAPSSPIERRSSAQSQQAPSPFAGIAPRPIMRRQRSSASLPSLGPSDPSSILRRPSLMRLVDPITGTTSLPHEHPYLARATGPQPAPASAPPSFVAPSTAAAEQPQQTPHEPASPYVQHQAHESAREPPHEPVAGARDVVDRPETSVLDASAPPFVAAAASSSSSSSSRASEHERVQQPSSIHAPSATLANSSNPIAREPLDPAPVGTNDAPTSSTREDPQDASSSASTASPNVASTTTATNLPQPQPIPTRTVEPDAAQHPPRSLAQQSAPHEGSVDVASAPQAAAPAPVREQGTSLRSRSTPPRPLVQPVARRPDPRDLGYLTLSAGARQQAATRNVIVQPRPSSPAVARAPAHGPPHQLAVSRSLPSLGTPLAPAPSV